MTLTLDYLVYVALVCHLHHIQNDGDYIMQIQSFSVSEGGRVAMKSSAAATTIIAPPPPYLTTRMWKEDIKPRKLLGG